jgi:aminoglycoside phosphotransferase (APT) family kinase protein
VTPAPSGLTGVAHALGPQLLPMLIEACDRRLHDVHWFKTDWQRSGAATAYATAEIAEDDLRPAVVKLPIGPREHHITAGLCHTRAPTPRVAFHGTELGGYDLAWVVMERLPGDPLAAHLHAEVFEHLADAAARFYVHTTRLWPKAPPGQQWDWERLLDTARTNAREHEIPEKQTWSRQIRCVQRTLSKLLDRWNARDQTTWCHGDLHAGNLMHRGDDNPWGANEPVLLDFAEAHGGHWVEDAVFAERLYWARPDVLERAKPVERIAEARKANGLAVRDEDFKLADIRRVLLAATVPARLDRDGHQIGRAHV